MMQHSTEVLGPRFSDIVIDELDRRYSRRTVSMAASQAEMPLGLVLAQGSDGVCGPYKGSGDVYGVLASPLPASETAQKGVAVVNLAIVNGDNVIHPRQSRGLEM